MAQQQLYTKIKVYANGNLLFEEAEIKLTRNSGLMPVNTTAKGFAGFSQGAPFIEADISGVVPDKGFEYNAGPDMQNANTVELTFVAASSTLTSKGGIMGDDISHGVNAESKLNIRFHGEFADWISL